MGAALRHARQSALQFTDRCVEFECVGDIDLLDQSPIAPQRNLTNIDDTMMNRRFDPICLK